MKLSVKWLAGIAVLVLAVVAVVGSTSRGHAAVGTIYVANTGQLLTTEPGQSIDDGDTYDTATTVWATYAADIQRGEPLRLIRSTTVPSSTTPTSATAGADADLLQIIFVDAGYDVSTVVNDDVGTPIVLNAIFATTVVPITDSVNSPIASAASAITIYRDETGDGFTNDDTIIGGPTPTGNTHPVASSPQVVVTAVTVAGDAIQVQSQIATGSGGQDIIVRYSTSDVNTIADGVDPDGAGPITSAFEAKVTSDVDVNGRSLILTETSRSSGRFVGYVRLTDQDGKPTATDDGIAEANAADATVAGAAVVRVSSGPLTIRFTDSDGTTRTATVPIDTSAPLPTVTAPAQGAATQNRQPLFSGTVNDSGSGLDISNINLYIDQTNDPTNLTAVISPSGVPGGTAQSLSTTGAVDGDLSFSFTLTPGVLPNSSVSVPDNIVDFQIRAADMAGNWGFSDSDNDSTANDSGITGGVTMTGSTGAFDANTVKIDLVAPALRSSTTTPVLTNGDHVTGVNLDAAGNEVEDGKALRVAFNDDIQGAEASDFTVTFPSNGSTHIPLSVQTDGNFVYLSLAVDIPANERPRIDLQGGVSDAAGNSTATGSAIIADGIAPTLTVTLSGGSGTGTGSESASSLTKDKMTITVTSNETLLAPPVVSVFITGTSTSVSPTALSFGTNTWVATYTGTGAAGSRAVVVSGSDNATSGTSGANLTNNTATTGSSSTKSFTFDNGLSLPTLTPANGGTTSQVRPFLVIDFGAGGEASTVSITEVTLDDVDVTSSLVASGDGKRFFILPDSDLSEEDHTLSIPATKAKDAAGNTNSSTITTTFTVIDRPMFDIGMFAGWNAISFPSNPVDSDINSVFTNAGHDAVLGWDPGVPGQFRIATRDAVSGEFTTTSENGLNSIRATMPVWVHSNNFEDVSALLVGESLPGDPSPPSIVSIPTVAGFNMVPIIDTSKKLTTGAAGANLTRIDSATSNAVNVTVSDYLGNVVEGRVYKWNPETLTFEQVASNTVVSTGEVLFVEITGTPTPIFP